MSYKRRGTGQQCPRSSMTTHLTAQPLPRSERSALLTAFLFSPIASQPNSTQLNIEVILYAMGSTFLWGPDRIAQTRANPFCPEDFWEIWLYVARGAPDDASHIITAAPVGRKTFRDLAPTHPTWGLAYDWRENLLAFLHPHWDLTLDSHIELCHLYHIYEMISIFEEEEEERVRQALLEHDELARESDEGDMKKATCSKGLEILEKIMEKDDSKLDEGSYVDLCNVFKELYNM
jgi:hypothetical protein